MSGEATPLVDVVVVHRDRHTREVHLPAEYELLPRSLTAGSVGAAVFLAFRRAAPLGGRARLCRLCTSATADPLLRSHRTPRVPRVLRCVRVCRVVRARGVCKAG